MDAATTSGRRPTIWSTTQPSLAFTPLPDDLAADVCVIGGGIAGLTTAYLLASERLSVIVLEDGHLGSGETGRTTAHLSNAIDDRYLEIERLHGEEGARLAAASHASAIDRIEQISRQEQIVCDLERVEGYLILSPTDSPDVLEREYAAARRAGLKDVELMPTSPLHGWTAPCLRFARQGQLHPLKYLAGIADAVIKKGGRIYTTTHATDIEHGTPVRVHTETGRHVRADAVVVATNSPVNDLVIMHTKQAAYRSYAIAAQVPRGAVPRALYWDTEDPYHYVRLQTLDEQLDLLIVGGEDHKTGQGEDVTDRHQRLIAWAQTRFPRMRTVLYQWSGQIMESIDGLAFIGPTPGGPENIYIATGDSGMGMTHGTIAGMLLTDLIRQRSNPWAALYDPTRMRLQALPEFTTENVNAAAQYVDWLTGGDLESPEKILPGEGAVIREGTAKLAIYRDARGDLHKLSAVCPHLGCLVSWNTTEKTWDCPCHGSRFDGRGAVLNGPANSPLGKAAD
jgi:glycine/D-amino acid oxidase-like deaminating enzyme/nitrite reductase/ring-hydroxylating ferredoxin subunit